VRHKQPPWRPRSRRRRHDGLAFAESHRWVRTTGQGRVYGNRLDTFTVDLGPFSEMVWEGVV
jgi:hypothetical protein